MKMNIKTLKLFSSFIICYLLFVICSCEQPFKAGLGPIIDLQAPKVVLEEPNPKLLYIRGVVNFKGYADDDYELKSVWFQISNYQDAELPAEYKKLVPAHEIGTFYRITDTTGNSREISWTFKIDTTLLNKEGKRIFPDGDFKIRLMAKDAAAKETILPSMLKTISPRSACLSLR